MARPIRPPRSPVEHEKYPVDAPRREWRWGRQAPQLTGLPPVVHTSLYNLPLRFGPLWPNPYFGLSDRWARPWPPEVWEAIAATVLRLVREEWPDWARAIEMELWHQAFKPLLFSKCRSVDADDLVARLRGLRVPPPSKRSGTTPQERDVVAPGLFKRELEDLLRPNYRRAGRSYLAGTPLEILRLIADWHAFTGGRFPRRAIEEATLRDLLKGADAPSALATRITRTLARRSKKDFDRDLAQFNRRSQRVIFPLDYARLNWIRTRHLSPTQRLIRQLSGQ